MSEFIAFRDSADVLVVIPASMAIVTISRNGSLFSIMTPKAEWHGVQDINIFPSSADALGWTLTERMLAQGEN